MQKNFFLLVLFLFIFGYLKSQNIQISGKVVDYSTNQTLEYASVALFNATDYSLVTGVITNQFGDFKLEKLSQGNYFIQIQFIGYETFQSEKFDLSKNQDLSLGNLPLRLSQFMVNEIEVSGQKSAVTNKLEKQVYRADQFESAKGGSAVDVLKNMPSVAVNAQGEITMRGSSGFLVLINDKPVLADPQTALNQLPANMINNVELITSPSAKYDPDGKTGIINITTKKGATDGTIFTVNVQDGLPSTTDFENVRIAKRHGADILFNYKKDKWEVSLGGNYTRNDLAGFREGNVYIENIQNNTINRFPSTGERSFNRYYYASRGSVGFVADLHNSFSVGIFSGKRFQERDANIFYTNSQSNLSSGAKIYDAPYYNANNQIKEGTFTLGNFDYTHTFDDQSKLLFSALYEFDDLYGNTHNRNLTSLGGTLIQYVQNPYKKPVEGYRLKLEYSANIGNGKFESGYQFRNDSQDGEFTYIISPEELDQPELTRFRGTALSKNKINSVYSQYSEKQEKLEYVLGLRYEYSKRTVELSFDSNVHELNLSNLFPSGSLQYSFSETTKLKAGFSRRIQRTSNNQLNPIPEREHSETLEIGDPDLLPEFVSLTEIGLIKSFKTGSIFATAYYQASKNPMQRVNSIYADTILNRVYTNVDKAHTFGIEIGANLHPTKWWTIYFGTNAFKQKYEGELSILGAPAIPVANADWVYSINGNTELKLKSDLILQANVNYLSARPTAQGEDSRFLSPNISLKKNLFNNRLTASVQWQNIDLGMKQTNRQRITTWGEHFYTTTNYIYETDMIMLNLSFNLNRKNGKVKLPESEFGEKEF